ncbi:MAG: ribosome biogenesis factor YjgA [Pseudomonadota bacterium]
MVSDGGNSDADGSPVPSKSQRKRDMLALQAVGEALITLPDSQLATIPVPDNVLDAVMAARSMNSRGALHRQKQYIGKLMRNIDAAPIVDALEALRARERLQAARHHQTEQWRDRLIAEGDAALAEFIAQYPEADRQKLRQLMRAAAKPAASPSAPKAARNLFRYLRELSDR